MNNSNLDILLEKFYRGETSLDEEQQLRQALSGDDADALLMQALEQMDDEVEVPADLQATLSGKIDEWEAHDTHKAKESHKARVIPLFKKRAAWAAAASVAVLLAVGWWLLRDGSRQVSDGGTPAVIAKVEKNEQVSPAQAIEPVDDAAVATMPSQPQLKAKPQRRSQAASAFKNNVEHVAQAKASVHSEDVLSASDEEIALAALEKFSTVLNKGMEQLDDANEKINDINNTIQQHLI